MCNSRYVRKYRGFSKIRDFLAGIMMAIVALLTHSSSVIAADPTLMDFEDGVRLFKNTHQLPGRIPLLTWDLPGIKYNFVGDVANPITNDPTYEANLPNDLDSYWERGYVPLLKQFYNQSHEFIAESVEKVGVELHNKNLPIHVLTRLPGHTQEARERHFWPDNDMWTPGTNSPILPLADPARDNGPNPAQMSAKEAIAANLQALKDAGITSIHGLWQDYEDRPHKPNGNYQAQRDYIASLPDPVEDNPYKDISVGAELVTVFDNPAPGSPYGHPDYEIDWTKVVRETTKNILTASSRAALDDVYGTGLPYGNYGHNYSGDGSPGAPKFTSVFGGKSPWVNPGHSDIHSMPVVYARTDRLFSGNEGFIFEGDPSNQTPQNVQNNQDNADHVYWGTMMRALSTNLENEGASGSTVPWITQYNPQGINSSNQEYDIRMTTGVFRDVLRHAWLRGIDGMISFIPKNRASNAESIEEMESIRYVMDEMLSYHTYLDGGEVLNYDVKPILNTDATFNTDAVWSGIKHPTASRAVVRVTGRDPNNLNGQSIQFDIDFGSGLKSFDLDAPYDGATYLVHGTGTNKHVRIDPRDNTAFLELDNGLTNNTNNEHNATFFKSSSSLPDPTYSSAMPGTQTLSATLGHRENRDDNTASVYVERSSASIHQGTGIRIENDEPVSGPSAFEAESFTAEVFFSVGSENDDPSQTHSAILGKEGAWYVTIDSAGALNFSAEVENAPLRNAFKTLPIDINGEDLHDDNLWHHLAVVYDGDIKQVQLFLDYEPVDWDTTVRGTILNDNIGQLSDVLEHFDTHPTSGHPLRGDILLGKNNFGQGFEGYFDEFRFTPQALEWGQFLQANGAATNPGSGGGTGAVPEPSSAMLALVCGLSLLQRRGRSRS